MVNLRSLISRLSPSTFRAVTTGLLSALIILPLWLPWHGRAQSPLSAPPFRGGGGHLAMRAYKVPFKPGPIGPDGKVHQLPPGKTTFMPEGETEQAEAAKERAAAGLFDLTTKPPVRVLSPEEQKELHWNPSVLNVSGRRATQVQTATNERAHGAGHNVGPVAAASSSAGFFGSGWTGQIPPDGGVAAGHFNIVTVVNSVVNVLDKNGNLLSSALLSDLFSPVGVAAQDQIFDPFIVFDPDLDRFFLLTTSVSDSPKRSTFLLAVSAADDVHEGWNVFAFDATLNGSGSSNNWCDQPYIGMDSVAVYFSCNMFSFPFNFPRGSFQYSKIRIMTKDELVNGPCCSWWDFWDIREAFLNTQVSTSVRAAIMHFARDTDGDFWVDAAGQGGGDNTLHIWHLTGAANCCNGSSSGPNLDGENDDTVGSFGVAPDALQPNAVQALDVPDTRVQFATWEFGHLSVGQTIACNQGGTTEACAAFTEIDVSGYPNMSNVNDWFLSEPEGTNVYYPWVEQNANADKMMVYTRSDGSATFPGAFAAPIPRSSICTLCVGSETTLQAGGGNYLRLDSQNKNRWGDYHGAAADPDFLGIWVEGEYASPSPSNTWSTWIKPAYNTYAPIDSPSPASLAFGNQAVFSSSGSQEVIFTNNGNASLQMFKVSIAGDSDFQLTDDGCSGQFILVGASCRVFVDFSPTVAGSASANLTIPDNTPAGTTTVPLSGTGLQAGTSTSAGSSLNPSTFGQAVTLTAQVVSSTAGTPTGTATFHDGTATLGTVSLKGGIAAITTAALSGGTHSITVTYHGDKNFLSSVSPALSQVVQRAGSSTTVTSSRNPSTFGQAVTLTATVTPQFGGTVRGTVSFKDGTAVLGSGSITSGKATFVTSSLHAGNHSITATYNGSAGLLPSTSAVLTETIHKAKTTTTLTSAPNPSTSGQAVTFTAKVTPAFGGKPTGTVTFRDNTTATALGNGTVNSSGIASFTTSKLAVGTHSVSANYHGDTNFNASSSTAINQVVK